MALIKYLEDLVMNENETVDLLLWIVLILGIVVFGLFYLFDSGQNASKISDHPIEMETPNQSESLEIEREDIEKAEPIVMDNRFNDNIPEMPNYLAKVEAEISSGEPGVTREQISILKPRPDEESAALNVPVEENEIREKQLNEPKDSNETIISETTKKNTYFQVAQDVSEGIIMGTKEAVNDISDFYKIRASGRKMVLSLEPQVETLEGRSIITIYNADQKVIGEYFNYRGPELSLQVTPDLYYYIKLHLLFVPHSTFDYKLRVRFQ